MPRDGGAGAADLTRFLKLLRPVDLRLTLSPLRRGAGDPTLHMRGQEVLRATRTPLGGATIHLRLVPGGAGVEAQAWGPGAPWAIQAAPELCGAGDDDSSFQEMLRIKGLQGAGLLRDLHRRFQGLRIPRTRLITEALVPIVLEQKVTGIEAHAGYRRLVRRLGEPAPGPPDVVAGLMLPPAPATIAAAASWTLHTFGIERKRGDVIRYACSYARRLDALTEVSYGEAERLMATLPGIGSWTAAEVSRVALGNPDAVSVGDFHLPHQVAWAFTGSRRGDDDLMLRLLEPYRGQRARVIRLIEAGAIGPSRRGPRLPIRSISGM